MALLARQMTFLLKDQYQNDRVTHRVRISTTGIEAAAAWASLRDLLEAAKLQTQCVTLHTLSVTAHRMANEMIGAYVNADYEFMSWKAPNRGMQDMARREEGFFRTELASLTQLWTTYLQTLDPEAAQAAKRKCFASFYLFEKFNLSMECQELDEIKEAMQGLCNVPIHHILVEDLRASKKSRSTKD